MALFFVDGDILLTIARLLPLIHLCHTLSDMKYRMLALDLDGTLFDSQGQISPTNLQAVHQAQQHGMMVVLCTGRGLNESSSAIIQLKHTGPIVLANGSIVSDPTTGQTLHRADIEPHLALRIIQYLNQGSDAVLVLMDPQPTDLDYLIINAKLMTENTRWWFAQIDARIKEIDYPTTDDLHHALRVGLVGPSSRMPQIAAGVQAEFGDAVFVQHFGAVKKDDEDVHILEVFASGVNKWAGLQWLAQNHGICAHEIAAVGDEINDIQMIANAGCGIAMGNAVEAVKQIADQQTTTNNDHGVAMAIENLLKNQW